MCKFNARPRVRWADGVEGAGGVLQSRRVAARGSNALTTATRLREAVFNAKAFVDQFSYEARIDVNDS